ncbi:MAG: hypothetical protein E6Q88_02665 [Lysobacteraceae bacterium]|nr:MAG: hypothetical protein E6Q88_02665 [Xanthomonadaceae bacterium]
MALTAACGLLASALLRAQGMHILWLRYAIAVIAAYLLFLLMLRLWVYLHDRGPIDGGDDLSDLSDRSSSRCDRSASAEDSSLDGVFDGFPDVDDAGVVLVAIAVLAIAVGAIFWAVWIAPSLLAELILDVALASGLYRRLRRIESAHWLRTAVRRTWLPCLLVLALAAGTGALLQRRDPGIDSIGDAFSSRALTPAP